MGSMRASSPNLAISSAVYRLFGSNVVPYLSTLSSFETMAYRYCSAVLLYEFLLAELDHCLTKSASAHGVGSGRPGTRSGGCTDVSWLGVVRSDLAVAAVV